MWDLSRGPCFFLIGVLGVFGLLTLTCQKSERHTPASSNGAPLTGRGGIELTPDDISELSTSGRPFRQSNEGPIEGDHPASSRQSAAVLEQAHSLVSSLAQTPPATVSWRASGALSSLSGFPADAQVAVSSSHVVVTARAVIAFYDKSGGLAGTPIRTFDVFGSLNLERDFGIDYYFDNRVVFDHFRGRFWIVALGKNRLDPSVVDKFVLAVSRSENPLDGWFLYWWNAVADPVFQSGDGADYPTLGFDSRNVFQSNAVINNGQFRYWRVVFRPADQMANGLPGSDVSGWQYWDLTNPDGTPADRVQMVVHHSGSPRAYFASRYGADQLLIWAVTDALASTQQLTRVSVGVSPFGMPRTAPQLGSAKPIEMSNFGTDVLKAVYRANRLYLVTNDSRDWDNRGEILNSVRLVRLNVASYPNIPTTAALGFIDRVFGARNGVDDPPNAYFHYGWPAVEVNRYGDMVLVYARTGQTIYPEARFSLYYGVEPDIRPSRLLKNSEEAYSITYAGYDPEAWPWGDTAGASVDPENGTDVWIAQQYAVSRTSTTSNNGNFEVWVGKVSLGTVPVPNCLNMEPAAAVALLENSGLAVGVVTRLPSSSVWASFERLVVVDQSPQPGVEINRGALVDLRIQRLRVPSPPISPALGIRGDSD